MDMGANDTKLILERISLQEFNEIVDATKTEGASREMAKMVLVDGLAGVDVAKKFNVSKQRVGIAIERIRCKHRADFPEYGLCKSSIPVPSPIMDSLKILSENYMQMDFDKRLRVISKFSEIINELSDHNVG